MIRLPEPRVEWSFRVHIFQSTLTQKAVQLTTPLNYQVELY